MREVWWRFQFRLFIEIFVCISFSIACPQVEAPCRCSPSVSEPISLICESAGSLSNVLQAISSASNFQIDSLLILDTPINVLPAFAFQDFTIHRLVLNRCSLSAIHDDAFDGVLLDVLNEVDFTDNVLRTIPQTGLPRLKNLRKIYLNRNRIDQLQPNSFVNYRSRDSIIKLELTGNRLTNFALDESHIFYPLRSLRQLSLEANALTMIPSTELVNQRSTLTNLNLGLNRIDRVPMSALDFPNLNSLSLEFNEIENISSEAFRGIPNLEYLYLTGNKFKAWPTETFVYVNRLATLSIGETPISFIPNNAFQYTPNLVRLEMSEAAVDTIANGVFQRTPHIQSIVLNKNRLSVIRNDYFQGLQGLYSVNLGGNRIDTCEPNSFANLPAMSHLDISFNQLRTLPEGEFDNSFIPAPDDRRVMYVCGNPWLCNSALKWFRAYLRNNVDIDIDKPGCQSTCVRTISGCPPPGTLLRSEDLCALEDQILPLTGSALSLAGWIILAIIMTILLISICLLAIVRYGISYRRKKQKDKQMEDEQGFVGSGAPSIITRSYAASPIDLDLPHAYNLDNRSLDYPY